MKGIISGLLMAILVSLSVPILLFAEDIILKSQEGGGEAIRDIESINGMPIDEDIVISDADCGLVEPAVDGIYKLDGVTIKLIPPDGWKKVENLPMPEETISFMPSCLEMSNLTLSVSPSSPYINIESTKKAFENDPSCLSLEVMPFAGGEALKTVVMIAGMKTQQVMFSKDDHLFILTFVAFTDADYDEFIADIDNCLESFRIVT